MRSVMVDVAPVIIDWVMQNTSSVNIDDGIISNLVKWKNGEKKPTFNQVESVSKATRIPLGYFFLASPPMESFPILQYRTLDSIFTGNPSRDLVDTINDMESIQEWMREYMIDCGYDKLRFAGSCRHEKDKRAVVRKFLETLDIAADWHKEVSAKIDAFKFFRRKLEELGILVMMSGIVGNHTRRSLNIEEFRAFTLYDDYAPLIFINANDSQGAKLFSLLHEAAHIWLGTSSFYNDRYGNADGVNEVEVLCNAIAAEILVPSGFFEAEWDKQSNQQLGKKIQLVANTFNCGVVVIARKALDNRLISQGDYQIIVDDAIAQFYSRRKSSDGNYYTTTAIRIDNRFIVALDSSIREGKTQFTDAYRLTNTNRRTFSNLVEEVRGIS